MKEGDVITNSSYFYDMKNKTPYHGECDFRFKIDKIGDVKATLIDLDCGNYIVLGLKELNSGIFRSVAIPSKGERKGYIIIYSDNSVEFYKDSFLSDVVETSRLAKTECSICEYKQVYEATNQRTEKFY